MKFVALHRVGVMARWECCVDHPSLSRNWPRVAYTGFSPLNPQCSVTWAFGWLDWFSLIIIVHCHKQLHSSPSPQERVSSYFLLAVKCFSGRLPFALVQLGFELLSSSALPLSSFPVREAL
jgi:hypothetical protein